MIKKFRIRFIIITMVLIGAVSLAGLSIIGVFNYQDLKSQLDSALSIGVEPEQKHKNLLPELGGGQNGNRGYKEAQLQASIFPVYAITVYSSDLGNIIVHSNSTAYMDEEMSAIAVKDALAAPDGQGRLDQYGLYYKKQAFPLGYRIAFTDTDTFYEEMGKNILMLAGFWIALMLAMFAITLFLARYATRPVEKAFEEQQRFIADASHELKTPLTIILADTAILADNPTSTIEEQRTWVEGISAEAERMKLLTEDLLTLAQADAGMGQAQILSEVDISAAVEMQVLQFDAVAFERGLAIDSDIEEGLYCLGEPHRVENIVNTLLDNACKYSRSSGTINVKLSNVKSQAVLSVHNEGDLISEEDLEHVFDRFYRSDKARAHEGGTASFGLGLSIAKSTVELYGGSISAVSDESGTTFIVALPLVKH